VEDCVRLSPATPLPFSRALVYVRQILAGNLLLEPGTDVECDVLNQLPDGLYPLLLSFNQVC
jgi:hypothetical protein